jgi:hypothetical protein
MVPYDHLPLSFAKVPSAILYQNTLRITATIERNEKCLKSLGEKYIDCVKIFDNDGKLLSLSSRARIINNK